MSKARQIKDRYNAFSGSLTVFNPTLIEEAAKYTIAKQHSVQRGDANNADGLIKSKVEYRHAPKEFGIHNSNIDAKRALVVMFDKSLADSSDEHIKRVAKEYISGSMGHYRIVRV